MSNKEQEIFFRAIEEQNIQLVQEMLAAGVNVNALGHGGTPLYRSVKLHNFELSKLLIENGADCNIVQLDFDRNEQHGEDGVLHSCFISSPIDLLCDENKVFNDGLLQYLLENRPRITEAMIDQRIRYCIELFDDKSSEMLFDYAASYLLRQNMYDHLWPIGDNALLTMITAILNINAELPNEEKKSLRMGSTHQAFYALLIRSLFEELVRFKLERSSHILSDDQYADILHEFLHNLEVYNLFMDINRIPYERRELFYPSIIKKIIDKLKNMKISEEHTLPMKWEEHALCVNFVRESSSIVIRIDNLNSGEKSRHTNYTVNGFLVMIPEIIGEISLEELDHNKNYFKSLIKCMKEETSRKQGIETVYKNNKLKYLDRSRVSTMAEKLQRPSKALNCFRQQADGNCFIKCHEPGRIIRSNNYNIAEIIVTIMGNYAMKLRDVDIVKKRNDCERTFVHYWDKEMIAMQIRGKYFFDLFSLPVRSWWETFL